MHWNGIVNKYGFEPKILAYWATEKEAFEHEKVLIACFKDMGYVLANKTDGGEGTSSDKLKQAALNRPKRKLTEEHKHKITKVLNQFFHLNQLEIQQLMILIFYFFYHHYHNEFQ